MLSSRKLDPYVCVGILGNSMHPAVVVKNLSVWFDANFSFADHLCNICKTCFIQLCDLRWVRHYLTDEAAILAANALVSSRAASEPENAPRFLVLEESIRTRLIA